MKFFPYSYGLLVLLFLLNSGTAFSTGSNLVDEQQIKVFLPQSSVINSDEYRLGEIAQLEGEDVLLLEKTIANPSQTHVKPISNSSQSSQSSQHRLKRILT